METLSLLIDVVAHYVLILIGFYVCYGFVASVEKSLLMVSGYSFFGLYSAIKAWVFVNPTWAWSLK